MRAGIASRIVFFAAIAAGLIYVSRHVLPVIGHAPAPGVFVSRELPREPDAATVAPSFPTSPGPDRATPPSPRVAGASLKALQVRLNSEGAQRKRLKLGDASVRALTAARDGSGLPNPSFKSKQQIDDEPAPRLGGVTRPKQPFLDPPAGARGSSSLSRSARPAALLPEPAQMPANVLVNDRAGNPAGSAQSECSIAALGRFILVSWNDGEGFAGGDQAPQVQSWAWSSDGGATFSDAGAPPVPSYWPNWVWISDPTVAADEKQGAFFLAGLVTPTTMTSGIALTRGTLTAGDSIHWSEPVTAVTVSRFTNFIDKPWLAADSSNGHLYLAYANFYSGGNRIECVRSVDGGLTWDAPVVLSGPGAAGRVQGARPAVGPGGELYVVWKEIGTSDVDFVRMRRSTDGGATFGPLETVATFYDNFGTGAPGFNRERAVSFPSIAVDRTAGNHRGRVYVAFHESFNFYDDLMGTGAQRVETDGNDIAAAATRFDAGDVLRGSLASGDQDWFAFEAIEGAHYLFWADSIPKPLYSMRLFCGDGETRLALTGDTQAPPGGDGFFAWTAPATGTYYMRMFFIEAPGSSAGSYRVYTGTGAAGAERARDQRDVFVTWADGGTGWSTPARVNDDAPWYDNWLPEVAVAADGAPYLAWYDWRGDACGGRSDIALARSADGGASWESARRLSSATSDWSLAASNIAPNQGDYIQLRGEGDALWLAWADARAGDPDVFSARVSTGVTLADEPADTLVAPGGTVRARATIANANELFAQTCTVTLTDALGWPLPASTVIALPAAGSGAVAFDLTVPQSAAATVNRITITVAAASGATLAAKTFDVAVAATTGVEDGQSGFALLPPVPNPSSRGVRVAFTLPARASMRLDVFGLRGERVRTLADQMFEAGAHQMIWDGRDSNGRTVNPGTYFVRLEGSAGRMSRPVVRIR